MAKKIRLKVASPCKASWEAMTGDDAVRFCGQCNKNVYQLSQLSTEQIEEMLNIPGEKRCVRFYQRKDGTVLTSDCEVGAKKRRRKQALLAVGVGALSAIGLAMPGAAETNSNTEQNCSATRIPAVGETVTTITTVPAHDDRKIVMGRMLIEPEPEIEPTMGEAVAIPDPELMQPLMGDVEVMEIQGGIENHKVTE